MRTKTALTWEQFLAAGKPDRRWEYVEGEVKFMSPSGARHGMVIHEIALAAGVFVRANPQWVSLATDVTVTMAGGNWRCPDWALVRRERFGAAGVPIGPVPFPPDVAFEVISPNDTKSEIQGKRHEYRNSGVVQVWVDPQERTVEVSSPKHGTRTFGEGEIAIIEEVPGFELNLFPPPAAQPSAGSR